jgi:hypothetical protein
LLGIKKLRALVSEKLQCCRPMYTGIGIHDLLGLFQESLFQAQLAGL